MTRHRVFRLNLEWNSEGEKLTISNLEKKGKSFELRPRGQMKPRMIAAIKHSRFRINKFYPKHQKIRKYEKKLLPARLEDKQKCSRYLLEQ